MSVNRWYQALGRIPYRKHQLKTKQPANDDER